MDETIKALPANLRVAATNHDEVATQLRAVPANHADILASLHSLGPVYAEVADEAQTLLDARHACYHDQADEHAELAAGLTTAATYWENHEQQAKKLFTNVVTDQL
jgi:hypothetical protein